ncbi:uncharacterized protein LOC129962676 [Argiope bruennichi]|uniref:uncharacterized protein LOC129962676 n=1 Tax=Argiope bruennichi TaxID=94029 RepID=UPI002494DDB7|nr:uncharacterized protein LOC129962676 [Argiope bruennichi]
MAVVNLEAQPPPPENAKREYNVLYIKSNAGILRAMQGVLSIVSIIMLAEGYCELTTGRYGTVMFLLIVALLESIFIIVIMVLKLDETFTAVDIPLSILLNDGIVTIFFFIVTNLALLSIGSCGHTRAARLVAALFILGLFVMMLAQDYLNYLKWQEKRSAKEDGKNSSGTTITESSPTVLT